MFENYRDVVDVITMAEMLGIGKNKAYYLVKSGKIKSCIIGKTYRIPKKFIIKYIEK